MLKKEKKPCLYGIRGDSSLNLLKITEKMKELTEQPEN